MIGNATIAPTIEETNEPAKRDDLPTDSFVRLIPPDQLHHLDLLATPPGHVVELLDVTRSTLSCVLQLLRDAEQRVIDAYRNPGAGSGRPKTPVLFPIVYVISSYDELGPTGVAELNAYGGVFLTREQWPGELKDLRAAQRAAQRAGRRVRG